MALVKLIESFSLFLDNGLEDGMQAKWALSSSSSTATALVTGRFGIGQRLQIFYRGSGSGGGGHYTWRRNFPDGVPISEGCVGCSFVLNFRNASAYNLGANVALLQAGTYQIGWQFDPINLRFNIYRFSSGAAGTLLGSTPTGEILPGVEYFVVMEFKIHNTDGEIRFYVNGVEKLSLTGQDTQNHASESTVDSIQIGASQQGGTVSEPNTSNIFIGDLYVNDDMNFVTNDGVAKGERKITVHLPVNDTADADFVPSTGTDHYAMVDDNPPDLDTTYVQGSNIGDLDLYGITPMSGTEPLAIDAIQVSINAAKTDASARSVNGSIKSGATLYDGPDFALATSYTFYDHIVNDDPATSGAAWQKAAIDALLAGPQVAA